MQGFWVYYNQKGGERILGRVCPYWLGWWNVRPPTEPSPKECQRGIKNLVDHLLSKYKILLFFYSQHAEVQNQLT